MRSIELRPRSLRLRITLAIVAIEIVMLGVLVTTSLNNFRHTYEHRLFHSADNIAAQFSATAARFLFELDIASLDEYVSQIMSHDELQYVAVFDSSGALVARKGELPDFTHVAADRSEHAVTDGTIDLQRDVLVGAQRLGTVRLGFTYDLMEATLREARNEALSIAAVMLLLTVIGSFLVARVLTTDLEKLNEAVAAHGAGQESVDFPDASTLEIKATVAAVKRMIRDREAAEQAIADRESFYQALFERSADLVLVLREDSRIAFAGQSFEALLGYQPDGLIGEDLSALGASDGALEPHLQAIKAQPESTDTFMLDLRNASGEQRTFEVVARNCLERPAINGMVLNCRDVTERSRMEARLRQSEKMQAIGNLTGGVAHDFNNLLAIVLGNLELLGEYDDPEERRQLVKSAAEACLRGADLTRNLLSFSRRAPLAPKVLDVNELVGTVNHWLHRTLPANIAVETSLSPTLSPTVADPGVAETALLNLFLNARDAMPDGGLLRIETCDVTVGTDLDTGLHADIAAGRYAMLSVSDTGSGIAAEYLDKVFEPFFTTKSVGQGSGVGLSMVHGFMEQSGGAVRVHSQPGEGATFRLYFPAATDANVEATHPVQAQRPGMGMGERILLAEDDADVRAVIERMLAVGGYVVTCAATGDQACALFEADPTFDLLLTDIVMPGSLSGSGLAERLRARWPSLPVVFISGYASGGSTPGASAYPDDAHLTKPVSRETLLLTVEAALGRAARA